MKILFSPFSEDHFQLLVRWLSSPHVKEFWQEPDDEGELRKKYLEKMTERGIRPQIIILDDQPIGYIQSYQANKVGGGWWPNLKDGVFGMDLLIGEVDLIEKGLGVLVIKEFVMELLKNPQVHEVIVDPDPENKRAIRAYEKAGFVSSEVIDTPNGKASLMKYQLGLK